MARPRNDLLTARQRQLGIYLVAGALLGYALVAFAGAARERRAVSR